jgi:anti-sigma B factor antagonist
MRQTTPFTATACRVHGQDVLTLVGEIDMLSGPKFARAAELLGHGPRPAVVFDMTGVTFMDSTGLTIIAGTLNRIVPGGGRLCIRGASPMICRLFEITGICESEHFEIAPADDDLPSAASG